jgi:hypothetical protein
MLLSYFATGAVFAVGVLGHGGLSNYTIGDVSYAGLVSSVPLLLLDLTLLRARTLFFSRTSSPRASSVAGGQTRFSL